VASEVVNYTDLIAERITALGGIAEGTAAVAAERSTLPRYPLTITTGAEHVEALATALATFGKAVRAESTTPRRWETRTPPTCLPRSPQASTRACDSSRFTGRRADRLAIRAAW
jgi:hypothetical protein